jgi:hypothetical protein
LIDPTRILTRTDGDWRRNSTGSNPPHNRPTAAAAAVAAASSTTAPLPTHGTPIVVEGTLGAEEQLGKWAELADEEGDDMDFSKPLVFGKSGTAPPTSTNSPDDTMDDEPEPHDDDHHDDDDIIHEEDNQHGDDDKHALTTDDEHANMTTDGRRADEQSAPISNAIVNASSESKRLATAGSTPVPNALPAAAATSGRPTAWAALARPAVAPTSPSLAPASAPRTGITRPNNATISMTSPVGSGSPYIGPNGSGSTPVSPLMSPISSPSAPPALDRTGSGEALYTPKPDGMTQQDYMRSLAAEKRARRKAEEDKIDADRRAAATARLAEVERRVQEKKEAERVAKEAERVAKEAQMATQQRHQQEVRHSSTRNNNAHYQHEADEDEALVVRSPPQSVRAIMQRPKPTQSDSTVESKQQRVDSLFLFDLFPILSGTQFFR